MRFVTLLVAIVALCSFAAPTWAGGEVSDGSKYNCGGTTVTFTITQNSIVNTVDVTATTSQGMSSTVTGTPGPNSSSSSPTCSGAPAMTTGGANGVTVRIDSATGKAQYQNENGEWVTAPKKRKKQASSEVEPMPMSPQPVTPSEEPEEPEEPESTSNGSPRQQWARGSDDVEGVPVVRTRGPRTQWARGSDDVESVPR